MKFLIVGNHTCGNRGDAAILRGLIFGIQKFYPYADFEITSRYPVSSSYLLKKEIHDDLFYRWHRNGISGIRKLLSGRLSNWTIPLLLAGAIRTNWRWLVAILPISMKTEITRLKQFDAIVHVGGSFFIDLYGPIQFEYSFAAILSGRPLFLIGHSLGPFGGVFFRYLTATLLGAATKIALREHITRELIRQNRLSEEKLLQGSDTAWLVPVPPLTNTANDHGSIHSSARPLIGITLRNLAPFENRLKVSQSAYEDAFALLVNRLIENGYSVVAASTCTGIGSYYHDDRMVALKIANNIFQQEHFHVVMEELNDIELGQLFRRCCLVIGTRLHSAIIAMNFGTPAIAIAYEHKSIGIMKQLNLADLSHSLNSLLTGSVADHALQLLHDINKLRIRVAAAVNDERIKAHLMIETCLNSGEQTTQNNARRESPDP